MNSTEQETLIGIVLDSDIERVERHILVDRILMERLIDPDVLRNRINKKRKELIMSGQRKTTEAKFLQATSVLHIARQKT